MGDERLMAAEATVRASGADWTIVRANWFDQNFDEGVLHPAVLAGAVMLPLGQSRHPFVDSDDIAAVAAAALTEPGHAGRTHVVTGPEDLTFAEAVVTIARTSGRNVVYQGEPDDHLAAAAEAGIDPEVARTQLAAFDALCRHPEASAATGTVRAVTGRDRHRARGHRPRPDPVRHLRGTRRGGRSLDDVNTSPRYPFSDLHSRAVRPGSGQPPDHATSNRPSVSRPSGRPPRPNPVSCHQRRRQLAHCTQTRLTSESRR